MSLLKKLKELFETPNTFLKKMQMPGYLTEKRYSFSTTDEYANWLWRKFIGIGGMLHAEKEMAQMKGRPYQLQPDLIPAIQMLEDEIEQVYGELPDKNLPDNDWRISHKLEHDFRVK